LKLATLIISGMYLLSAFIGYATYGDNVQSPILLNLPHGILTTLGSMVVTIHVLLACPLLVTTFSLDMERILHINNPVDSYKQIIYRSFLRTCIMSGICITALAVPFFGDFMTLLGSLSNTMLIFVFPILFHYKLFGIAHLTRREHVIRTMIVLVGVFSGCIGGSQAIYNLYIDFSKQE
jgi:amino acid permease